MIDFNTDKLIIFYYPAKAGGKFLINSLGLSDCAVFQDKNFAQKQLQGNFSKTEKLNYLLTKIKETDNKWADLNLGCGQLFGKVNELIFCLRDYPLTDEVRKYFDFEEIIEPLSRSNKYFFKVAHNTHDLKKDLMFWPNAKVVELNNCNLFIETYRTIDENKYDIVKGDSWPKNYPSVRDYLSLDLEIQNDINLYYPDFKYFQDNQHEADRIIFIWDTENYFLYEKTLSEFKKLCNLLNINDIDLGDFELYYNSWIDKIKTLKKSQEQL